VVFDIDDFKAINDRIGHLAGDSVLAGVAERLQSVVRSADIACRVGGDEFAAILPESDLSDAEQLYRRVQFAVGARPIGPFERLHLSAGLAPSFARTTTRRRSSSAPTRPSTRRRKPARVSSWPPTKSASRASYLDQPATGGLPAPDGLLDLREEAGGVRFQGRIQKVTRRSPRAGLICALCRDFVLLRTSHFPPHLPVECVDNSRCTSAARSSRRVRCGEGASLRTALPERDPLFGGGPARSPQRAGNFVAPKRRRAPWALFANVLIERRPA
jgi:hypothetical protein